jgi:hypothetical protein
VACAAIRRRARIPDAAAGDPASREACIDLRIKKTGCSTSWNSPLGEE